ncbi:unnamed protein product [Oikopleura dioica]|uniref:EF-hand domain-containing protein n=1 Tax=Oikopleura dioica TaxID=34765 RepID=E4WR29_OIKDI|nr:unnamed protein product [Oikopleura dioica]CBY31148.1 unnamed protein product [Oikopleura dioica]
MLPFRQFARSLRYATAGSKRMAFPLSPYERNMIVQALGTDERKAEFRKLDSEQGGNIDLQSLNKLFEQDLEAVEKFLEGIMNSVDLDNGGTLNFAEFLVLMVKQHGVNGVQRAFLSYDVDGSGSITRDELKEWMTRHGRFLTRRQVQMMVDAVDVNGDGEIDYGEFLMLVCRRVLRMKSIVVDVN